MSIGWIKVTPCSVSLATLQKPSLSGCFRTTLSSTEFQNFWRNIYIVYILIEHLLQFIESSVFFIRINRASVFLNSSLITCILLGLEAVWIWRCWASKTKGLKIRCHFYELLIEKSSIDLHRIYIQANSLPSFEVAFLVQSRDNFFRRNDIRCLVYLLVTFQSFFQVSFRIVFVAIDSWHEVVLTCFNEAFYCFVVVESCIFTNKVIFVELVASLGTDSVQYSFHLQVRVEFEFWTNLFCTLTGTHTPIQVFRKRWLVIYSRVLMKCFFNSFTISAYSSKVHHSGSFSLGRILVVLLDVGNYSVRTAYRVNCHLKS